MKVISAVLVIAMNTERERERENTNVNEIAMKFYKEER
jgi:hypothetical protein